VNLGSFNASGIGIFPAGSSEGSTFYNAGMFFRSGEESVSCRSPIRKQRRGQPAWGVAMTSYRQGPGAVLHLHVGEFESTSSSRLAVAQTASLAGALQLTTEGGFTLEAGQTLPILSAGSREGEFSALEETGSGIGGGLRYDIQYGGTGAALVVVKAKSATWSQPRALHQASAVGAAWASSDVTTPSAVVV
jgi:hypothetical protein